MSLSGAARVGETRKILRIIGGVFALAILLAYASQLRWDGTFVRDYDGYVLGVDFVNGWMMGRSAWQDAQPGEHYDLVHYNAQLAAQFGFDPRLQQWSYPPTYLVFAAWFGWLSYAPALALFWLCSFVAGWFVLRAQSMQQKLAIAASPAALIAFISGQATLLLAALQFLMTRWFDRRPIAAGLLLGLLIVKPHLAVMYPFFLIATRRWKVFVAAAFSTMAVIAATVLLWGTDIWDAYRFMGVPLQHEFVLKQSTRTVQALMPTLYMDMRILGASYATSMALHALAALFAIAALFHRRCVHGDAPTQILILATASIIATPYLMSYDTLFFAACLVVWLGAQSSISRVGMWLVIGCFFLPVIHFVLGVASVPGAALLPIVLLGWLLKQK